MKKHPVLIMAVILVIISLACSGANLENISDIGITGCTTHSGDPVIACETAKADVNGKSDAQFNFGTRVAQTGIRVAHITLRLTVEGQGEAQASVKSTGGQVMTVNASQGNPGEITGDVPLTWEQVRDAAEATRTGMDIDNVYFLVNVESLDGAVAQGVQMKIDVTIAP